MPVRVTAQIGALGLQPGPMRSLLLLWPRVLPDRLPSIFGHSSQSPQGLLLCPFGKVNGHFKLNEFSFSSHLIPLQGGDRIVDLPVSREVMEATGPCSVNARCWGVLRDLFRVAHEHYQKVLTETQNTTHQRKPGPLSKWRKGQPVSPMLHSHEV